MRRLLVWLGPSVALFAFLKVLALVVFLWMDQYAAGHPTDGSAPQHPGLFTILGAWDGKWYKVLAEHGYHPSVVHNPGKPWDTHGFGNYQMNPAAFFPLYPGLIALFHLVTGLGFNASGLVVAGLSSLAAAAGIFAVGELLVGRRAGVIAAALWAVAPSSGVQWAVYSDSLFIALAAWTVYFVLRRRWLTAGVLCVVAGFSRPTAIVLSGAILAAAAVAVFRHREHWLRPLVAVVIAPIGTVAYTVWAGVEAGDIHAISIWEGGGWAHFFDYGQWTWQSASNTYLGRHIWGSYPDEDFVAVAVLAALPIFLIMFARMRPPLFLSVYIGLILVTAYGSHGFFGSESRYLLPAFPLLYPLASALRRVEWPWLIPCLAVLALASGWYAGFIPFELGIP